MNARAYLDGRRRQVLDLPNAKRPRWTVQDTIAVKEVLAALDGHWKPVVTQPGVKVVITGDPAKLAAALAARKNRGGI